MSIKRDFSFTVDDVLIPHASISEKEPKIEELLSKLGKLQQAKLVIEKEVKDALSLRSTLQDEEDNLNTEILNLEGALNEKEETCRSLQLKCVSLEQESQRQLNLKQQKEELVKQYSCQIQETKLRHRKIRMKFESQLQQLIGQHKNLYTVFNPERLPIEVQSAEYSAQQLLKAEYQKLEQVAHLQLSKAQASDAVTMMHDESFVLRT